eukprot:jgi/Mesen1/7613/ME000397S06674
MALLAQSYWKTALTPCSTVTENSRRNVAKSHSTKLVPRHLHLLKASLRCCQEVKQSGSRPESTMSPAQFAMGVTLLQSAGFFAGVANAADEVSSNVKDGVEAVAQQAAAAPGWLTPVVLAFPLVVYGAFSVYRDKVRLY